MNTLHYTYGPTGRDRIEFTCDHGSTALGAAEMYYTPEAYIALMIRHHAKAPCECLPETMIREYPDARDALRHYEAMAADPGSALDSLDLDLTLQDLADLREHVPCPGGCVVSWTAIGEAGGKHTRRYGHADACPEKGKRRPEYVRLERHAGPVQ